MTRITITVPDHLAEQIRTAGGDNVSAWIAARLRDALLREEVAALAAWDAEHQDPEWEAERERQWNTP